MTHGKFVEVTGVRRSVRRGSDTVLPGALDSETARQGNEGERERPKESELGGSCDRRPWLQLMCCALEVLLGAGASRDRRTGRGAR